MNVATTTIPGAERKKPVRLLLVSPGIPNEREGGSSVVFYEYTKALKRAGYNILNVLLLQPDHGSAKQLAEYRAGLETPGQFEVLECRSPLFVISSGLRHRFDAKAVEAVRDRILAFKPDVVLALDIVAAWAVADLPIGRKVAWLGDLNFETLWYATLYARREGNRSLKYLIGTSIYALLWARVYRTVLKGFDSVVVCAKSSEKAMARIGIRAKYLPYPWPELSDKPRDLSRRSGIPTLLFFGGLGGLGSRSAFHFLMNKIFPLLRREFGRGGFKVIICGRGSLPGWTEQEFAARPEIQFLGYVEDLDGIMDTSHVLIAPIDVPVGNRTRILTAISRHLPVIAHRNTALGNPDLVDGETCYLAATPEEFVDRIGRLMRDPDKTARIVDTAFRSYRANFGPTHASALLLREVGPAVLGEPVA